MPLIRDYPQATSLESTDAFVIDRVGVGTMFIEDFSLVPGAPYLFSFSNTGPALAALEIVGGHVFGEPVSVPENMAGSQFFVDPSTLPEAQTVLTISKISGGIATTLGTLTVETDGSYAIVCPAEDYAIGDLFKLTGPLVWDHLLANMWFTGVGVVLAS